MKKATKLMALCLGVMSLCFISCDESFDPEIRDSIYLTEYNNDWDGGYDYSTIEYNEENQVSKIINKYSEGGDEETMTMEYFYNEQGDLVEEQYQFGNETTKYKSVHTLVGNTLTYNNYVLTSDGIWEDEFYGAIVTYEEQGKVILNQFYSGWSAEDIIFSDSTVFVWANNNVVQSKMYSMYHENRKRAKIQNIFSSKLINTGKVLKSNQSDLYMSYKMTYDDKNNPFSTIRFDYHYIFQTKNNVIQEVYTREDGRGGFDQTVTYEYNDKNYPTRGVIREDGEEIGTVSYKYKD